MRIHRTWRFLILVWLWAPRNIDSFGVLSPASLSLLVSPLKAPIRFARPLTSLMTLNALTTARTGLVIAYKKAQKRVKPFNYYEKSNIVEQPTIRNINVNQLRRDYYEQEADKGLGIKFNIQFTHPLLDKAKQIQRKVFPKPKKKIKFRPLDSYPLWIQQQIQPNPHSWTGLGLDPRKIERKPLPGSTSTTIEIESVPHPNQRVIQGPKQATIEISSRPITSHLPPPPEPFSFPISLETSSNPHNIRDVLSHSVGPGPRPVPLPPRPIPPPPKPIGYLEDIRAPSGPGPIHDGWLLDKDPNHNPSHLPPQLPMFLFPPQHFHKPPFHPNSQLVNNKKEPLPHDKYMMSILNVVNNKESFLKALPWRPSEANTHDHVTMVPERPERDIFVLNGMNGGFQTAGASRLEVHRRPNEIPVSQFQFSHGPNRPDVISPTRVELHQGPFRPNEDSATHLPRSVGQGGEFVQLTHPSEVPELSHAVRQPNMVPEYGGFRPIYAMKGPDDEKVSEYGEGPLLFQHSPNEQVHFLAASQLPRDKYFDLSRRNITDHKHAILIPIRNYDLNVEESSQRLNFTLFRPKNVPQNNLQPVSVSRPGNGGQKPKPSVESQKPKATLNKSQSANYTKTRTEPRIITKDTVSFGRLNNKNAVILTKVKAPLMAFSPSQPGSALDTSKEFQYSPIIIGTPFSEINQKNTVKPNAFKDGTTTRDVSLGHSQQDTQPSFAGTSNGQRDLAAASSQVYQSTNREIASPNKDPTLSNHDFHSERIVSRNQAMKISSNSHNSNIQPPSNQNPNFNPTNQERIPLIPNQNFKSQRIKPHQESIQLTHSIHVDNEQTSSNTTTNMSYIEWLQKYYPDYYNKYFHNIPAKTLIAADERHYGKSNNAYLDWLNKYFPNWRNVSYTNQNVSYYDWLKTYYPVYYQKHYAAKLNFHRPDNSHSNSNFNRQAVSASESFVSYREPPISDYTTKPPDWTVDVSLKRPRAENPLSLFESRDPFSSLLFGDKYQVPYPSPAPVNVRDYLAERVRQNAGKGIKASIEVTRDDPEDHALNNVVNYADYILKRTDSPECLVHLACYVDGLIHQQVLKKRQLDSYQRRYTSPSDEDVAWRRRQRIRSRLLNGRNNDVRCDQSTRSQRDSCQRLASEEEVLAKMIEIAFPT